MDVEAYLRAEAARKAAALVDGRHYTTYVAEVKDLRGAGDHDAAAGVLLRLVDAVEREARIALPRVGSPVPPWYHRQLAACYRKLGDVEKAATTLERLKTLEQASV